MLCFRCVHFTVLQEPLYELNEELICHDLCLIPGDMLVCIEFYVKFCLLLSCSVLVAACWQRKPLLAGRVQQTLFKADIPNQNSMIGQATFVYFPIDQMEGNTLLTWTIYLAFAHWFNANSFSATLCMPFCTMGAIS